MALDIEVAVQEVVRRVSGAQFVNSQTRLFHDLGLAGDDIDEILERLHRKLGTDFSALRLDKYFPQEHEALGAHYARLVGSGSGKSSLTVQHLVDVARAGVWFEPGEAERRPVQP